MQLKEVAKAYKKTEMFGAVETKDPETVVVLVMEELIKSVKSQTISDVPVGAFS